MKGSEYVTQKLYYKDAYIKEFITKGLEQNQDHSGRWYIILNETAFYPTGGGQPCDLGTLNGVRVLEVEETEEEIRHYVEERLENIGKVKGEIDWSRRFDHMQQHAGQHILTAAFEELFQIRTVSFHLGKEFCTIDLEIENLSEEILFEVERRANDIILENRPIEAKWVSHSEASEYKLRKELSVTEDIRLVIIPDYDYNGCGGTHPRATSQVSVIKILDWEKQKNMVRVRFICGKRVLIHLHQKHFILKELGQLLSAPEDQLPVVTNKLVDANKAQAKSIANLQETQLQFEAEQLLKSVNEWAGEKVIEHVFENRPVQQLQKLARLITEKNLAINVFFVAENGDKLQFVFSRDQHASFNMKAIVKDILPVINGKGGGSDSSAQGGGAAIIRGKEILTQIQKCIQTKNFTKI
ncbi:alanyl-tRNA editing protein [Robertmurraya massiliosenegalensis]|uniref:alanyl-tRNA editing protein n=1 Tax=Robertmurraya massiliosenegalensis TaxID=1287657 RepID=UPI0002E8BB64|nr:DHHA1 domain-containing protein [Robertmurraya massiliosenegalensis]